MYGMSFGEGVYEIKKPDEGRHPTCMGKEYKEKVRLNRLTKSGKMLYKFRKE